MLLTLLQNRVVNAIYQFTADVLITAAQTYSVNVAHEPVLNVTVDHNPTKSVTVDHTPGFDVSVTPNIDFYDI